MFLVGLILFAFFFSFLSCSFLPACRLVLVGIVELSGMGRDIPCSLLTCLFIYWYHELFVVYRGISFRPKAVV